MTGIAYSSGMELIDSHVITYRIYCLKHPETHEVFYVGKTMKELKERLSGHIGSVNTNGKNQDKNDYIRAILSVNQRPIIEEIEAIYGTCYIHKVETSAREYYWINHFQSIGVPLKNHFGIKTDPLCAEWETYVRNIKDHKGEMRNYYCGKNKQGMNVYDEEKMNDDGFILEKPYDSGYSSENTDAPIKEWIYEKIYSDDDPNYIVSSFEET